MQRRNSPLHSSTQSKSKIDGVDKIPKKSMDQSSKAQGLSSFKFQDKEGDKENSRCNSPFTQYSPSSHGSKVQFLLSIFDQPGIAIRKRPFKSVVSAPIIAKKCQDPIAPNPLKQARFETLRTDHSTSTSENSSVSEVDSFEVHGAKAVTFHQPVQKETRLIAEIGVMSQSGKATPVSANYGGNQFLPVQDTATQIEMECRLLDVSDTLDSFLILEQISMGDDNLRKSRPSEDNSSDCTSSETSPSTLNLQEDADSTMYLSSSIMVFSPDELQDRNLFGIGEGASKINASIQVSIQGFNILTCHDERSEQISSVLAKSSAGEFGGELVKKVVHSHDGKTTDILSENPSALSERITVDDLKNIEISVHPVDKGSNTLCQQYGMRDVDGKSFDHTISRSTVDANSIFHVEQKDCLSEKSALCELKVRLAVAEQLLHEDAVTRELAQKALMSQFTALLSEISQLTENEQTNAQCVDKKELGDDISSTSKQGIEACPHLLASASTLGSDSAAVKCKPADELVETLAHVHSTLESLQLEISGLGASNFGKASRANSPACGNDGPERTRPEPEAAHQHAPPEDQTNQAESAAALSVACRSLSIFCDSECTGDASSSSGTEVSSAKTATVPPVASMLPTLPELYTSQRCAPQQSSGMRDFYHDALQANHGPSDAYPALRYNANQNQGMYLDSIYSYSNSSAQPVRPSSSISLDRILWPERQEQATAEIRYQSRVVSASSDSVGRDSRAVGRPTLSYAEYYRHVGVAGMGTHVSYPPVATQLGAAPGMYSASSRPHVHAREHYERADAEARRAIPEPAAAPGWYSSSLQPLDPRGVPPPRAATATATAPVRMAGRTCAVDMHRTQTFLAERPACLAVPYQPAESSYAYGQQASLVYASAPRTAWTYAGAAVTACPAMAGGLPTHQPAMPSHQVLARPVPPEAAAAHAQGGPFHAGTPRRMVRADLPGLAPQSRTADGGQLWSSCLVADGGQELGKGGARMVWMPC
jgi:hypothetical protein